MSKLLKHLLRLTGLVLLQVLILNNIYFGGYINPFVYILFIMMLPFNIPGWLLLLVGFGTGTLMDLLMSTPGLHAGATVFLAFARPYVLQLSTGSKEPESINDPTMLQMGGRWWFSYTATLVMLHHFVLFFLQSFSFSQFGQTLLRIVLSVIATQALILLLSFFFMNRKSK